MNFGFSEEQELLRSTAREFLAREVPMTAVRELMDDPRGYQPAVYAKMAELGWLGLLLPLVPILVALCFAAFGAGAQ
jgi:alkylation response protein AidB-like acyl-CoA dehydrogenase